MHRPALLASLILLAACADRAEAPPSESPPAAPSPGAATPGPADTPPVAMGEDSGGAAPFGRICPDPEHPCVGFPVHDLSFVLRADGVARDEDVSEPFFALLLASGPACSIGEPQRAAAQAGFPGRKVFAHRFECDPESNVTYEGADPGLAYLAVYAGATRAEADSVLAGATAYPGANLRRMRVKRVHP